ncbi:hypothetical protein DL98DRAFT_607483 [Cadophora sp. DSE1049]|nr:hypothetical protein DL98DRAFT_607483 [Cadophora sp. DSE1049]
MFSFTGYSEVLEDLPPFFENFLHLIAPIFRSPMRRPRERPEPQNVRATWAQAEMFVAYKLSIGYHEECLESMIEEEVNISRDTGDFDPLFLQYCLRILRNMRNAGQFSAVLEDYGFPDDHTRNRDGSDDNQANTRKFTDVALVSRHGKDKDIAQEMGLSLLSICYVPKVSRMPADHDAEECQFLDEETEERLQHIRKRLHTEAERIWHENAAEEFHNENYHNDPSHYGYSRRSRSPSPRSRRVAFPDEPTMTESSFPSLHRDSRSYNTAARDRDRSRGRSRSRPTSRLGIANPDRYTHRELSSSIRPGDSVSQLDSSLNTDVGADFSILRLSSPPNTSTKSNVGFTSHDCSSYVSGSNEAQRNTPFRGNASRRPTSDLRNMFQQLRVGDDRPGVSSGRRGMNIPLGNDRGERQSAHYSNGPGFGTRDESFRATGRLRSVSRGRMVNQFSRRELPRSPSTDSESTIMLEKSARSKGKEKEDQGGQRSSQYGFQGRGYDTESGPRYRSESRMRYEARNQSELFPSRSSRPLNNLNSGESRHREASDISSSRTEEWAMRQESRPNGISYSGPARSTSRHRSRKPTPRSPLADGEYKSHEEVGLREDVKLYGRGHKQSRSAGTRYVPPHAETVDSTVTGYTSRGKRSNKDGPPKRR